MIKLCPKKCFIVLTETCKFSKLPKWLKCSCCGYAERIGEGNGKKVKDNEKAKKDRPSSI